MKALWLAAILMGQAPAPETPGQAVAQAAQDIQKLPEYIRPFIRYLTLYNLPEKERPDAVRVLAGHVNGLSREIDLAPPALIGTSLLRLNLADYGWDANVWEQLADVDPWFHVRIDVELVQVQVQKTWPAGVPWSDGKSYPKAFSYWAWESKAKAGASQQVLAPWVSEDKISLATLVTGTQSKAPILRADWFLNQTVIQEGRKPGYYDFLGVKNQKDFEKLVRFDAGTAGKLEHRRVVALSGIAMQPRRAQRDATVLGGYWRTFDVEKGVDRFSAIRLLNGELQFQATEAIAPLPNGMMATLLCDDKGTLQNKAPDNIVGGDRLGGGNDTRLHINLSCYRCHFQAQKESGIKDLAELKIGKLSSVDYQKYLELKRQYLRDGLPELISLDRAGFERAIKATTGWDGHTYAQKLQAFFSTYEDARIDATRAAADCGVSPAELLARLTAYERATGNLDPVLSVVVNGGVIPIRQWEEAFAIAMQNLRQVK